MALTQQLATVRESDVEGDDEVAIARRVQRTTGRVAALDEAREGHRGQLALGVRLVQPGPQRGPLRRVLADRERVQELQPSGIGEDPDEARGALIGIVVRALEQRRVAVKEVEIPVDHAVLPGGNTTSL